ncbi:hypothetical protein BDZ91DRAFT_786674 [Kalaharituber pfeilii]|nr:hypothetical protein BDZ91DRAFT_786674 [Kalaharituber pfeilii]
MWRRGTSWLGALVEARSHIWPWEVNLVIPQKSISKLHLKTIVGEVSKGNGEEKKHKNVMTQWQPKVEKYDMKALEIYNIAIGLQVLVNGCYIIAVEYIDAVVKACQPAENTKSPLEEDFGQMLWISSLHRAMSQFPGRNSSLPQDPKAKPSLRDRRPYFAEKYNTKPFWVQ